MKKYPKKMLFSFKTKKCNRNFTKNNSKLVGCNHVLAYDGIEVEKMNFSENLQKLRKEKGLSQEALAEQLNVTRQSVSKWESNVSYPEMDKLIALCKIFDCDLDSLVNGSVDKKKEREVQEITGKEIFKKLDTFMKKFIFFFESMTAKDVFKFLIDIFFLIILILLFRIPFVIIEEVLTHFLRSYADLYHITNFIRFLLDFIYIVFSILIFIYVFKIKYLDQVENDQIRKEVLKTAKNKDIKEKETEKDASKEEIKVEKIYIQKTGKSISDVLATLVLWFCKFWVLLFLVGFIASLFPVLVLFGISISFTITGLPLLGVVFALLGGILFLLCLIEPCINFLFNQKYHVKRILITALVSFVFFILGTILFTLDISKIQYYDEISPQIAQKEIVEELPMKEEFATCNFPNYHNISYLENESLQDKVRVKVRTVLQDVSVKQDENGQIYIDYLEYPAFGIGELLDIIKKDLKKGRLYNYQFDAYLEITIESSQANLNQIQQNRTKCSY